MGGYSYGFFKNEIKNWIIDNFDPNSTILDVGCGSGTYYNLLYNNFKHIDGVEVFEPNIIEHKLKEKYERIFCCDIKDFKYEHYDLIIFGDILEHLPVKDAQNVLNYACERCNNLVVALPYNYPQDAFYGNKYEEHKQPDLTPENVLERYPQLKLLYGNNLYGYYIKNN